MDNNRFVAGATETHRITVQTIVNVLGDIYTVLCRQMRTKRNEQNWLSRQAHVRKEAAATETWSGFAPLSFGPA